jgi:hypothetical protein
MSYKPAFSAAIEIAPADADFVAYVGAGQRWVVVKRNDAGQWVDVVNASQEGYELFAAGASRIGKSVFNAKSGQFDCGSAAQMLVQV